MQELIADTMSKTQHEGVPFPESQQDCNVSVTVCVGLLNPLAVVFLASGSFYRHRVRSCVPLH
jgi:hypothetical protein